MFKPERLKGLAEAQKAMYHHRERSDTHYRATNRSNYTTDAYQGHLAAAERHDEASKMHERAFRSLMNNKDAKVGLRALGKAKESSEIAGRFSGSAQRGERG